MADVFHFHIEHLQREDSLTCVGSAAVAGTWIIYCLTDCPSRCCGSCDCIWS